MKRVANDGYIRFNVYLSLGDSSADEINDRSGIKGTSPSYHDRHPLVGRAYISKHARTADYVLNVDSKVGRRTRLNVLALT